MKNNIPKYATHIVYSQEFPSGRLIKVGRLLHSQPLEPQEITEAWAHRGVAYYALTSEHSGGFDAWPDSETIRTQGVAI
jgi:hypothetical protein